MFQYFRWIPERHLTLGPAVLNSTCLVHLYVALLFIWLFWNVSLTNKHKDDSKNKEKEASNTPTDDTTESKNLVKSQTLCLKR